jgi:hypothetical protein
MHRSRIFGLFALLTAAACGAPRASAPQAGAPQDPWEREQQPLAKHTMGSSESGFSASSESSGPVDLEEKDGLRQIVIPIGTQQPIRCFVYPKAINLAQTLRLFINNVVDHVDKHQVDLIDAGQADGIPYLFVGTTYVAGAGNDPNEKGMGQVKYLAARGDSTTTLCLHDEPGYRQTFTRIVTGFIASQDFGQKVGDAARRLLVWRAVSVQRAGTLTIGVIESRLYEGENGFAFASSRSMLLPAEGGGLVASDEAENQFSNAHGDIVEAKYVKIVNDSVAYNLGLSLASANRYEVAGVYKGEKYSASIPVSAALPDFASQTASLRKLFAAKRAVEPLHWYTYSPQEPSRVTDVAFEKKGNSRDEGIMTQGESKVDVSVDELGMQKKVTSGDMTVEQVWQSSRS